MKNIRYKWIICVPAICLLLSAQLHIYAQSTEITKAEVEFTAGEGPTLPVNPEDPGVDIPGTPVSGSLVVIDVSDFIFGSIPVSGITGFYDIKTIQPNIQVVDLRGTGVGWWVDASVTRFTNNDVESLPGARIHIYGGRPSSLSASDPPVQVANRILETDNTDTRIITAGEGAGTGLWVMRWYPAAADGDAYIKLEIPAGVATVGTHRATINWTLGTTP